jgi:adenine-specific DNA methylase
MKSFRVPVFALKSPTIAECIFESFDNATNSFSISSNDSSHDIIIFVETKLDNLDILNVPNGYSYITKNRKKMCKKSGGIVIIYKSRLSPCTPVLSTSNRWLYIHRNGGWWWRRRR